MNTVSRQSVLEEDQLVSELYQLGITYLSNPGIDVPKPQRSSARLMADIIIQPNSRIRTAVIALFLLQPEYEKYISFALDLLNESQVQLLKLFYTAAVYLQRSYESELQPIMVTESKWLPDMFGEEFGISTNLMPDDALFQLGIRHQEITNSLTNWSGTYKSVVRHLIRYKMREIKWNQLLKPTSINF